MSRSAQGHLAMFAFSAMVAGSFALGVLVANEVAPAALNAVRFWLAAAIIGGIGLWSGRLGRSSFEAPWRYAILGGLYAIYFVMMFEGLKTAPPVSAAAVFTLTPIMTAVIAIFLVRQQPTARIWLALAVGGAGALWVIFRGDVRALVGFDIGRGEAIYFIGCVAHAVYTPMVRKLHRGEPAVAFSFATLVVGGVILTIWGAPDLIATDWSAVSPLFWITLVYLAVFASAATFVLLQVASLRLPSSKVMAYTYLIPSWVILWEVALHGLTPAPVVAIGVVLTAGALVLLLRD